MGDYLSHILITIEIIIIGYFVYVVAYNFILSFAGLFYRAKKGNNKSSNRIAVIIAAYKEDTVIREVASKALEQSYPKEYFDVIVAADSLRKDTLDYLSTLPLIVHEVNFDQSTKVKSLISVLNAYHKYELAVILDADNIMEPEFLSKINSIYNEGHTVIQGRRVAKNNNTSFAVLDGLSEMVNNHIYRQGTTAIGWASSLIGSGMAFKYDLLRNTLDTMESVGGFDRELEVNLLLKGHKSYYLNTAIVYDEKIENAEVFGNQRKRWISSQYIYLSRFFFRGMKAFLTFKWATFNSSVLRNIQLPRVINLGLLTLFTALAILLRNQLHFNYLIWPALFLFNALSFIFAVPISFYNKDFFAALASLPKAFSIMFSLLFKLKGANKKFIHTPHTSSHDNEPTADINNHT